ncbi:MAG TPA: hypothetical protein VNS34_04100 [Rhizobiaceae bacterium]|nr:hypothetical protein [Rhizobiaceae bacterium]
MKTATALACAALFLAGCTSSGDATKRLAVSSPWAASQSEAGAAQGSETSDSAPDQGRRELTVGTTPISPNKQAAFCQDEVGFRFNAEPQHVSTRQRVVAADGSTTIAVAIDDGNRRARIYDCRLDASNRFIDVVSGDTAI